MILQVLDIYFLLLALLQLSRESRICFVVHIFLVSCCLSVNF